MFCLAILFVFIPIIVIITDLGVPNILNWDFAKRWDHLFFDKPRTLRHPTFLCVDSIPTLRRTLRKLPWLAKFNWTPMRSFATPSLCCGELIYLHIYIKSNYVAICSFWCWDNFFESISSHPQVLLPPTTSDKGKVLHIQDASYHEVEPWMEEVSFLGQRPLFTFIPLPPPPRKNGITFQPKRNSRTCF